MDVIEEGPPIRTPLAIPKNHKTIVPTVYPAIHVILDFLYNYSGGL